MENIGEKHQHFSVLKKFLHFVPRRPSTASKLSGCKVHSTLNDMLQSSWDSHDVLFTIVGLMNYNASHISTWKSFYKYNRNKFPSQKAYCQITHPSSESQVTSAMWQMNDGVTFSDTLSTETGALRPLPLNPG